MSMAMNVKAVLSTLVVFCIFICATTAMSQPSSQPWLAVMTYPCRRSTKTCVGVVLDNHWVLTTANCFSKCNMLKNPLQLSVYVNIPSEFQGRLASSIHPGSKVYGSLVWQHPDFNSSTFANNLALVQLGCHNRTLEKLSLATNCSAHVSTFDGYVFARRSAIKIKNSKTDEAKCFAKEGTGTWYHLHDTLQMLTTTLKFSCMETTICSNTEKLITFMQENKLNCTDSTFPVPSISTSQLISATPVIASKIPSEIAATSTEIPSSSHITSSSVFLPSLSVSMEVLEALSTTQVIISTEMPISTVMLTKKILTEIPVETQILASTSTEIPKASTSTSSSTQVATSTKMQTMTEASAPSIMPTSTSVEISTSTLISSSSLTSLSVVADTSAFITPTKTPTSGCQMSIKNGVATPLRMPGFLIIRYTCNVGYRFKSGTRPIILGCTNGEMLVKPPPCELIKCPPVEPIDNGQVVVSGFGLGDGATYSCNEGYVLFDGYTVRRCTENLEWTGNVGVCKRACPIPLALVCNDGHKIFPSAFKYGMIGDSPSYRSEQGYAVIGEPPVCQPNSTWSAPPKCLKLCNEKQVIANAKIVIHRNASSYTRSIMCNDGYKAVGFAEQRCTSNAQWTPHFQECKKTCNSITLDDGIVEVRESPSFLVALLKCEEGFHLEPVVKATVCVNGQWSPSVPRCVRD